MTTYTCVNTGQSINLIKEIANSGEGKVWETNHSGYLAKIYHSPSQERIQKLQIMVACPPLDPNSHLNHISFAWPKSLLKDSIGNCVGFLMPAITGGKELIDIYNPQRRKQLKLEIDWRFLHTTALNIASIIQAIHAEGYVLGDIKPQNILVNNRALPSIIDTDSFQVEHPITSQVYRCAVGSPGFTPPELIGQDFSQINQTDIHDRFRLAVIIYHLLFGDSPSAGKWIGTGETPEPNELVKKGFWLYGVNSLIEPVPRTISLDIVHPEIKRCFLKCFNDGYANPNLRPSAAVWVKVLKLATDKLSICSQVDSHYFSRTYEKCYWCDRANDLGVDIFAGIAKPLSAVGWGEVISTNSNQQQEPNSAEAYNTRGNVYYNNGDYDRALADYNKAIQINPNYADAYNGRGNVYWKKGDYDRAFTYYNQAIQLSPKLANSYNGRGNIYSNKGDHDRAFADYNQAIQLNPFFANPYSNRGGIYYNNGDYDRALADYNEAIQLDPKLPNPYSGRGNVYKRKAEYDRALADYNKAIQLGYNYAHAYNDRGNVYYDKGDYDRALADYNQAIQLNPNYASAYHNRGLVYYNKGDYDRAIADYNQAIQLDPNLKIAYANRDNALKKKGNNNSTTLNQTIPQFSDSTGQSISLVKEIANSGEGKVWETNRSGYLAKIYHSPSQERIQKLQIMVACSPLDPNSHLNHISFAWPKSLLKDGNGNSVGFLMPAITGGKELIDIYNPQRRKQLKLEIDWRFLHTTALNIASIIQAIHAQGYVLGDIKPQNILVNNRALPSIIDTDSFQVEHPITSQVYRCEVGSPGFTPPELIGKDFSQINQTELHDRFRLAVIIYHLLFGDSPFAGRWIGTGETPTPDELIKQGFWLHGANSLIKPVNRTIPLDIVHPEIKRCFLKCFNDGYANPNLRPSAAVWAKVLKLATDKLSICGKVDTHYFSQTYEKCYWCDRANDLGVDIFPGIAKALPAVGAAVALPAVGWVEVISTNSNQQQEPNSAEAYNTRGIVYYNNGDYDRALADYNKAIQLNPNFAIAYNNRGLVYDKKGDYDHALADYNQAIQLNPNLAYAYNGRGNVHYNKGDNDRALADYNKAIQLNPNLAYAYNGRGNVHYNKGDNDRALADYNQAIQLNPNDANAYIGRGNIYDKKRDYDRAIADYNKAIQLDPNLKIAYVNRDNTLKRKGNNNTTTLNQTIPKSTNNILTVNKTIPQSTPSNQASKPSNTSESAGTYVLSIIFWIIIFFYNRSFFMHTMKLVLYGGLFVFLLTIIVVPFILFINKMNSKH